MDVLGRIIKRAAIAVSILVIYSSILGCTVVYKDPYRSPEPYNPPPSQSIPSIPHEPPQELTIALSMREYIVANHRVLNDSIYPVQDIRVAGRYSDGDSIFIKVVSAPYSEYSWLAKVPDIKDGDIIVTAKRQYSERILQHLPPPPDQIIVYVNIVNKRVASHTIDNIAVGTFGLYIDTSSAKTTPRGKVYNVRSRLYEDAVWDLLLPTGNGEYNIFAVRRG